MEQGTDAEGGFLVPEEFINQNDTVLVRRYTQVVDSLLIHVLLFNVNSKDGYLPTTAGVATYGEPS